MNKKVFEKIDLTCMFQNTNSFGTSNPSTVLTGMLSQSQTGSFLFQETLPRKRDIRNAKLYEGSLVSIVRRKDGYYYPIIKGISKEDAADKSSLAFRISTEISEALNVIC